MTPQPQTAQPSARPNESPIQPSGDALRDFRFRHLLGRKAWATLPETVRRRFGKRLGAGQSVTFAGQVLTCRMSLSGWILAQACRLIGAPLPLERGGGVAAIVTVTEDGGSGGQVWTRVYARKRGLPQVIHSVKRFAGATGLEEYLGRGIGIALSVCAIESGIRFSSDHYFLRWNRVQLHMPRWMAPGLLTIDHVDCGGGAFTFTLNLHHPLLGEVMHQHSLFRDQCAGPYEGQNDGE